MKSKTFFIVFLFIGLMGYSQNDNWDHRIIESCNCEQGEEVARVSLTFVPGFDTEGCTDFEGYIDPDMLPNNGGAVSDGEFNMNYIRVFTPLANNATDEEPVHGEIDFDQWSENITYFDGLGREIQKVSVSASAAGFDVIQPIVYDDLGRLKKEHLPCTINQESEDGPGGYRTEAETEQEAFYTWFFGDNDGPLAFAEKDFDGSPLNRVMKQAAPGYAWRLQGGEVVEFEYESNSAGEVMLFEVNSNNELVKSGYYVTHKLYRNSTIDENGNKSAEYKNFQGQVILKKGEDNTKTYYVYDDFGLLRYVLPPLASDLYDGGNIPSAEELEPLIYSYRYDERKRMIEKKLPGAKTVYMVYNDRDQLVLTQDGNQREDDEWSFTKYDVFNRPIITGIYVAGGSQAALQAAVDSDSDYFEVYDESTAYGYSNNAFPGIGNTESIYTLQYYDNYDALDLGMFDAGDDRYEFDNDEIDFMHLENDHECTKVKGLPTVNWTKVPLNSETVEDDGLASVTYYNIYEQPIQVITDNHLGGYDIVSSRVNFTGDVETTNEKHIVEGEETEIKQWFTYDRAKRLTNITHQINGAYPYQLLLNKYNELGQLRRKKLHNGLKEVENTYNIRGWLTDINDIDKFTEDELFAMRLDYNTAEEYPQYNGNIGAMSWTSLKFSGIKTYDFEYDGLNRLTNAQYADGDKYSTAFEYDKNGNIEHLERWMEIEEAKQQIDDLVYHYTNNGKSNQLQFVNDDPSLPHSDYGFADNGSFQNTEYNYDENGNMTEDLNKGIDLITYNHLNLPTHIYFTNNGTAGRRIGYVYTADGIKLRKYTHLNTNAEGPVTDYVGAFVYENNELQFIQTSEGRLVPDGSGGYNYEYALKDLPIAIGTGNTRVMFSQTGEVLQDQSYYPFGMSMGDALTFDMPSNLPDNKYLYNGKELQMDFDLGWYDYGARFYDPAIARFHTVDPLASDFPSWTPYHFVHNNPIVLIDPTGMSADWFQNEETGDIYYNSELKKGDESQLGENWAHLGENGMFSDGTPMTNDVALLGTNKSLTNLEQNADGSISAEGYMKADKAEGFMDKQGYDLVPTQQTIYESESSSYFPTSPGKGITIISGAETRITEKVGYIKSGNMEIGKTQIDDVLSKYNVLSLSKVSRYKINYTDNGWKKFTTRTINLSKPLSGTHDYRMKRTYKNWNQYPGNNSLINKFKKEYGTK
jgi:RHS repeat-associated protein